MQNSNGKTQKKDKKSKKTPKWLHFGFIALALVSSVLIFLCSVLLYN